jgi:hypothetical protein
MAIQEVFEELVELEDRRRATSLKAALFCSGYMLRFLEVVEPGCTTGLVNYESLPHQEYTHRVGQNVISMRIVKSDSPRVSPNASADEREEMLAVGRWMVESAKLAYVTMCSVLPNLKDLKLVVVKENGDILFERNTQYSLRIVAETL